MSNENKHAGGRVLRFRPRRNDAAEFERLYRESYSMVYNYVCYRMPGDPAAEDIVADSFMRAARAFESFDPTISKFSTWVITIAKRRMIDHFRKVRPMASLDDVAEPSSPLKDDHEGVDDRMLVQQLLTVLSDEEREMVILKYREGMRNVDIAHELNMNASTVSTMLSRAMAKMRAVAES